MKYIVGLKVEIGFRERLEFHQELYIYVNQE